MLQTSLRTGEAAGHDTGTFTGYGNSIIQGNFSLGFLSHLSKLPHNSMGGKWDQSHWFWQKPSGLTFCWPQHGLLDPTETHSVDYCWVPAGTPGTFQWWASSATHRCTSFSQHAPQSYLALPRFSPQGQLPFMKIMPKRSYQEASLKHSLVIIQHPIVERSSNLMST